MQNKFFQKIAIVLLITILGFQFSANAQAPQGISYQAVARDLNGQILANTNVALRFSILQGSATGTAVYVEKHNLTTNLFGLLTLQIGQGTAVSGDFSTINWALGSYFTKVEIDINGGTNFVEIATSQMLSVPYALYANKAKSVDYNFLTNVPMNITPRSTAKSQKLTVSFSGGDNVSFSQASSTCPLVYADVVLVNYQASTTIIHPLGIYFIDSKRFEATFDIPSYVPSGLYDIILGPNTGCPIQINSSFKIH